MSDDFSDLESFNGEFEPKHSSNFLPNVFDALADGDYDFEVVTAKLDKDKDGQRILATELRVNGGMMVQHTRWLTEQSAMNALGADLATLGIDTKGWGKQVSIKQALPAAVKKMTGIRFRAKKVIETSKKDGKQYKKFYIQYLLNGQQKPVPAAATSPAAFTAPAPDQAGKPVPF